MNLSHTETYEYYIFLSIVQHMNFNDKQTQYIAVSLERKYTTYLHNYAKQCVCMGFRFWNAHIHKVNETISQIRCFGDVFNDLVYVKSTRFMTYG